MPGLNRERRNINLFSSLEKREILVSLKKREILASLQRLTHVMISPSNIVPVTMKMLDSMFDEDFIIEFETNNGERFGSYVRYQDVGPDGVAPAKYPRVTTTS